VENNSNITQDLLETIERYYTNAMPNVERQEFEKRLETDSEFKIQVEDIKLFILSIESQSFKEQLNEYHKDIPEKTHNNKSSKIMSLRFLKYAAAVIILIAIGSFWFFGTSSHEKLYTQYFIPDPGLPTTMGKPENYNFYDAMVNYKRGDYKIAISKWEKIHQGKPDNDTINYFLGVAHLADNNIEKSIPFLKKTADNTESNFNNDAHFYLGLAYLKINNRDLAIKYLKLNNSEKSKKLLDKLK
jgi:tetratricopeptide (TPR) repeat protein